MAMEIIDISSSSQFIDWIQLRDYIFKAGGGLIYPVSQDSDNVFPDNDNDLCQMILQKPHGMSRCVAIHQLHLREVRESMRPTLFRCHAGFWNIAVPMHFEDICVGAVLGCGILDHTRKSIDYKTLADELDLDYEIVKAAVRKVPLLSKSKIQAFQSFLSLLLQNLTVTKINKDKDYRRLRNYERGLLLYNSLYKIYKEMRSTLEFIKLQAGLIKIIKTDTNSDAVFMFLLNEKNELVLTGASEEFQEYIGKVVMPFEKLTEMVKNIEYSKISGHPIPDMKEKIDQIKTIEGYDQFVSEVSQPMISNNIVIGFLELKSMASNAYDFSDKQLVTFITTLASQCAVALENALLRRQTELLSVTDGMTGLYNFRYFSQKLSEEITRCARYGHILSLIMIDLDKFKNFNDTFGHPAGDSALGELAEIMLHNIRDVDLAVRYGGEEFAIILPETGPREAHLIIERIREMVAQHDFIARNHPKFRTLTISAGIASFPHDATTKEDLIERADKALYYSKAQGRNRVTYYPNIYQSENTDIVKLSEKRE